jgi:hypothetical protein
MALVTIVFFAIVLFTLILCYALFFKQSNKLLILAIVFILVFLLLLGFTSFHSITLLNKSENYQQLGPYGDYIGGILNPLIAVFGVFAAGFAFYAQYKANRLVQEQFKIQQFESQFYEMLRLYRANVGEMKIKNISGRKCFARMLDEYKFIYYETEYYLMPSGLDEIILNEITFYIFYYGVGNNIKEILYDKYKSYTVNNEIDNLIERLERYKEEHISQGIIQFIDNNGNSRNFNFNYIPFKGHVSRLDHYFRHLFQTVSYIVENDTINEKDKYNYIKLLRAQLSNYEFIILYFNGLTDMGYDWVSKGYFTEYKFLKNLPYKFINYSVNPVDFLGMTNSKGEKIFDN